MKSIIILIVGALACWAAASTKIRTSLEVVGESLEDRIVSAAGKGRVAIRLHEKRLNHLRESLIKVKALRKFYEAKLKDLDDAEEELSPMDAERRKDYRLAVNRLTALETSSGNAFTSARKRHDDICTKVIYLEEKLSLLKAISGVNVIQETNTVSTDDIERILDQLELEVHQSEAEIEIGQRDENFL